MMRFEIRDHLKAQRKLARGYGGRIMLWASTQAIGFYEKLGFVMINADQNQMLLTEEAAQKLLE
jgi:hypothetical protein